MNHSIYYVPNANYHFFIDRAPAAEFSSPNYQYPEGTIAITSAPQVQNFPGGYGFHGTHSFERTPHDLFTILTSVSGSLHLSARFGCSTAYLLGVDLYDTPERYHFYNQQGNPRRGVKDTAGEFAGIKDSICQLAEHLKEHYPDFKVYNLSENSAIDCFLKIPQREMFNEPA